MPSTVWPKPAGPHILGDLGHRPLTPAGPTRVMAFTLEVVMDISSFPNSAAAAAAKGAPGHMVWMTQLVPCWNDPGAPAALPTFSQLSRAASSANVYR